MKLKPCPFCGGEAKVVIGPSVELWQHAVECKDCGANTGYKWGICPSVVENKAIEAWNRREPIDKVVEQLEECRDKCVFDAEVHAYQTAVRIVKGGAV